MNPSPELRSAHRQRRASRESYGRLIGVSLGPGDPGLITRRGWEVLNSDARWTYPVKKAGELSYALDIALRAGLALPADAVALVFPMTTKAELLARAWLRAAADTVALLAEGRDVLFLVEGDASTYSTFGHLARAVRELQPAIEVEVIAGVSSYCASAARVGRPIAEADETLAVFPASYGVEVIDRMLDEFDSLVLLKVKPMLDGLLDLLERRGIASHAVYVEKVGTPDERVVQDVLTLRGEAVPYLSLMLLKNPGRAKRASLRGCRAKNLDQLVASSAGESMTHPALAASKTAGAAA
ncbi:MAG TPA: precorrin-2 C(20)-methyltransferase [Rhodocyclaceae bacterium]|nr:precorrin-2 C(20)-methyltransferase [Rhodocyclaceae bacterium]